MNRSHRCALWLFSFATLLPAAAGYAQLAAHPVDPPASRLELATWERMPEQAKVAVEHMRAQRRAQAAPTEMFSPFYSVAGRDETEVYLLNNVTDPVRVQLAALNTQGEVLPLGELEIGVTRHRSLSLRDAIRPAGGEFHQGSLRLSFLGDADSLQAWTIVRRGRQVAEIGFETANESATREIVSFWSGASPAEARAVFRLLNAGDQPLSYRVDTSSEHTQRPSPKTLEPGQSHRTSLALEGPGFVRIQHDGEPGALKVAGLLEGGNHLSLLPVARREDGEQTLSYEIVRAPWNPRVAGSLSLDLFNISDGERRPRIDVIDPATGSVLLSFIQPVAPIEVVALDLGARLKATLGDTVSRDLRLRVSSQAPGLLISGKSRLAGGEVLDMPAFKRQDAHASGSYPLLPLATHEVFTTLANLGDEPAQVVAQFYWQGGTYAFGPVRIEPGASYRLDVAEVAARGEADLLGRVLDPEYTQGFLKWSARGGSTALIARTEARAREGRDSFGFNCLTCCGEFPWGEVIPQSIEFVVGASPRFEACYNIDTCNGTMGPFLASPNSFNVPSPFSWDGRNISASAPAKKTVSFSDTQRAAMEGGVCIYQDRQIFGAGVGVTCITRLKKAHKPAEAWSLLVPCSHQVGSEPGNQQCLRCRECCDAILLYHLCTGKLPVLANSKHAECLILCETDLVCP